MMGYKFDSHRYITRGVAAEIPLDIQLMLFESIEIMREKVDALDWLQVMKLEGIAAYSARAGNAGGAGRVLSAL